MNVESQKPKRTLPAVITGLTRVEYDLINAMNWSRLKIIGKSPAHYRHSLIEPKEDPTDAMVTGTATHVLTFEPETFRSRFAIWDGPRRAGKEWKEFCDENEGKTLLTEAQADEARTLANAIRNNPMTAKYVAGGKSELTLRWTQPLPNGGSIEAKARLDFVASVGAITDAKTTKDASPLGFGKQVANLDYLGQCAWYADGYAIASGKRLPFIFIAAEKGAPHVVQVYRVNDELLAIGRARYQKLLEIYAKCAEENHWPGYVDGETDLVLPHWALPDLDDSAGGMGLDFGADIAS